MLNQKHTGRPGLPGGALRAICFFAALMFCGPASWGQESRMTATDPDGSFYAVSSRYNNRNEYLHISKMGRYGGMIWQADYDTGAGMKAIGVVANSGGLVILAATRDGDERSFSLIYYTFDNFMRRNVPSNARGAVPVALATDKRDNIYVALNTKRVNQAVAELWKYDRDGAFFWSAVFDPPTNAYAQEVQTQFNGDIAFGVTVPAGSYRGEYEKLLLLFNSNGARLN